MYKDYLEVYTNKQNNANTYPQLVLYSIWYYICMKSISSFLPTQLKSDGSLFGFSKPTDKCSYCGHKLYEMMNRPLKYCKSKECPHYFQYHKQFVTTK